MWSLVSNSKTAGPNLLSSLCDNNDLQKNKKTHTQIPCIGVSFGFERIYDLIALQSGIMADSVKTNIPQIYIGIIGDNVEKKMFELVNRIRKYNIYVECNVFDKLNVKFTKQLQYTLENKIPYMIVIGENEIKNNKIKIKNINSNIELELDDDKLEFWLENTF